MKKNRGILEEERYGLFSEEDAEEQINADEMSDAEAGWLLGYSDY